MRAGCDRHIQYEWRKRHSLTSFRPGRLAAAQATENYSMKLFNIILTATALLILCVPCKAFQERGGRETSTGHEPPTVTPPSPPPPATPKSTTRTRTTKRKSAEKKREDRRVQPTPSVLSIYIAPSDSTIILEGVEYRAENGSFIRNGLRPGTYKIIAQRNGYQHESYQVSLEPGRNLPLNISLEPLAGILNVTPTVADSETKIIELATNRHVGTYLGSARNVELPPGRYQILVSKEGYLTTRHEVLIQPAEPVFLKPSLDLLPKPSSSSARQSRRPSFRPDSATQVETSVSGKFIVVVLTGRSGDMANALGAIDVTLAVGSQIGALNVSGMLTGYPCQVDFVRLKNVAEYSFIEPPGAANQWARAVVRIRPKESKRPVQFLINWKSLQNTSAAEP